MTTDKELTHDLLVVRAASWLRAHKSVVVITDMTSAGPETPDAIGWDCHGRTTLVECKASRSDFNRDHKKHFRRAANYAMGQTRFYMAPAGMLLPSEIPEPWGLLEVNKRVVRCTKIAAKTEREDRYETILLLSALRRMVCSPGVSGVNCRVYTESNGTGRATVTCDSETPFEVEAAS